MKRSMTINSDIGFEEDDMTVATLDEVMSG